MTAQPCKQRTLPPGTSVVTRREEDVMIAAYRAAKQNIGEIKVENAEKRRDRARRKEAKDKAAGIVKPEEHWYDREQRIFSAEVRAYKKGQIHERVFGKGYVREGTKKLSGHEVGPVREEGLRSNEYADQSRLMEYFPSLVARGWDLRGSWGKENLMTLGDKVFTLDLPIIEGNKKFLGFLRWDTDLEWPSAEAAKAAFLQLASDGDMLCAPHLLVGLELPDGRFIRPHAILGLPFGKAVWNEPEDTRCSKVALAAFKHAYYAGVEAMLHLGADPEAPAMSQQVKNPLSPEWRVIVVQDNCYPSLSTFIEGFTNRRVNRAKLTRMAAAFQSEHSIQASNEIYNVYSKAAFEFLRRCHFNGDDAYHAALKTKYRKDLTYRVHQYLDTIEIAETVAADWKPKHIVALIAKVAEFAVGRWNPSKAKRKREGEGALMGALEGKDFQERMAAGGKYSAALKASNALEAIRKALEGYYATEMGEPSVRELARLSGLNPSTIQRRKDEVAQLIAFFKNQAVCNRARDKKQPPLSIIPQNITPATTPAVTREAQVAQSTLPSGIDTELHVDWWAKRQAERDETEDSDVDEYEAEIGIGYRFTETEDTDPPWDVDNDITIDPYED